DETERLSEWVASLRDHSLVAIDLEPTGRRKSLPWPPQTGVKLAKGRTWKDLDFALSEHPRKQIDAEQLASLWLALDERPIDLAVPSAVRHILFEPGRPKPTLIREGDIPGKFIRRLKVK
ncbi:MAG: hypothetical protein AAF802_33375, partial [Planctomycetota bacterium]